MFQDKFDTKVYKNPEKIEAVDVKDNDKNNIINVPSYDINKNLVFNGDQWIVQESGNEFVIFGITFTKEDLILLKKIIEDLKDEKYPHLLV